MTSLKTLVKTMFAMIGLMFAAIVVFIIIAVVFGPQPITQAPIPTQPTNITDMFPSVYEIGNGQEWSEDGIKCGADGSYRNTYHKNNCEVSYTITKTNVSDAMYRLDRYHEPFVMKFAGSSIGDASKASDMLQVDYNLQERDGMFIIGDIVVGVTVFDTHVSIRDISRYAHFVEKKI